MQQISSVSRQRTLSSPVPMNVAMSPTVSKAPPPTPLAVSSPISQEHLMPRPISPIGRQKAVCCPKCGHSFLASIGSYTNLFANSNMTTTNSLFMSGHQASHFANAGHHHHQSQNTSSQSTPLIRSAASFDADNVSHDIKTDSDMVSD